jgi:hypothetical protein
MKNDSDNSELLKKSLIRSFWVFIPGLLFGLFSPCESNSLMIVYLVLGLPWSLALTTTFENLLKVIEPLSISSGGVCL